MTNYDAIITLDRDKNIENIAKLIFDCCYDCSYCPADDGCKNYSPSVEECLKELRDWLNSEKE